MILGMSLATFTMVHVIISLIAIVAGLVVMFGMLGPQRQGGLTFIFLLFTILTSATIFVVCQFILTLRPPLALIAPLYLVYGLTGSFCIMCMAHARQLFPRAITGQAVTAVNFFGIGGSFCIQWWLGLIIKPFGADAAGHYPPHAYTVAFLCAATGTLLALLWYLPLARARRES